MEEEEVYLQGLLEDVININENTTTDDNFFTGVFTYLVEVFGTVQTLEDLLYDYAVTNNTECIVDAKVMFKDALKYIMLATVSTGISIDEVLDSMMYELQEYKETVNGKSN